MHDPVIDTLPCAVVTVDPRGRILGGNQLFTDWLGSPLTVVAGEPLSRFLIDETEDASAHRRLAGLIDAFGSRRPVLVARRSADDGGAIVVLMDASDRGAFEEELVIGRALEERTRTRLQLIIDASIAFSEAEDERQLGQILAATVAQAYRAEEAAVFLTGDNGAYAFAAGEDPFDGLVDTGELIARAVAYGSVIKISSVAEAAVYAPALGTAMLEAGVHAIIAAPLRHDDLTTGLFVCFFHHPRQFDAEAAPLADALAGHAAQVATTLRLQRRLRHAATHDETTGLPNRRFLEEQSSRYEQPDGSRVAAIFIDLDGFKRVNDELGHHTGDQLLREIGRRLQSALREDDVVARYGGDEFIVICEVADVSAARDLAERLRRNLAAPFDLLPPRFPVGASIGVSVAPAGEPAQIDQLIRAADQAMYRSKATGGNRITVGIEANPEEFPLDTGALTTAPGFSAELRGAVGRGEIEAWFQPQIDLRTGTIVAAEALCRWRHPQLGLIGPATFIPVAEDADIIGEIGIFMAEQCLIALETWSTPTRPLDMSVNVSPLQLKTSEFGDWLAGRLAERPLAAGGLTIEITESRPIADVEDVVQRLQALRDAGVGVAIDDFGAGHASLDQLERLLGTEVKLDRSLVSDLSETAAAEMANAVAVAAGLGIRVVAEGVETMQHLERVRQLGCDRAQGYLISRPVPASQFADLLVNGMIGARTV